MSEWRDGVAELVLDLDSLLLEKAVVVVEQRSGKWVGFWVGGGGATDGDDGDSLRSGGDVGETKEANRVDVTSNSCRTRGGNAVERYEKTWVR